MKVVEQPDILIIEGLMYYKGGMDYPHDPHRVFVSDLLIFSIYVDADKQLLKSGYIQRFLRFRKSAFSDPSSYFHHYSGFDEDEACHRKSDLG